jgi:hypothetical protein
MNTAEMIPEPSTPASEQPVLPSASRRGLLGKGLTVALAASAALAALPAGAALAAGPADGPGRGPGPGPDPDDGGPPPPRGRSPMCYAAPLCRVSSVSGADFAPNSPGSDPLRAGEIRVFRRPSDQNVEVYLRLAGAVANTAYDVQFEHCNDHGREDLGSLTTDGRGNCSGKLPNTLSGSDRVGVFVVIHNGSDEFVSCI